MGEFDSEATAAYHQNLSDISALKDPRSKDASQRCELQVFYGHGDIIDIKNILLLSIMTYAPLIFEGIMLTSIQMEPSVIWQISLEKQR